MVDRGGGLGPAAPAGPSHAVIRRLNRIEYDNTVRDLLGDATGPAANFPADGTAFGFDNIGAALTVPPLLAENLVFAAEQLARNAVAKLPMLVPCAAAADEACATKFITDFGQRAWRRPLAPDEVAGLVALYRTGTMREGFKSGIEVALRAMLVAPDFVFRVEVGTPDPASPGRVNLTPWEVASRLSYFLWQSMPDDKLYAAAAANALSTPQQITAEAERMLLDPRAKAAVARFHEQWLGLGPLIEGHRPKDPAVYKSWKTEFGGAMRTELSRFIDDVFWRGPGAYEALFTADFSYTDANLAKLYGVTGHVPEGDAAGDSQGGVPRPGRGARQLRAPGSKLADAERRVRAQAPALRGAAAAARQRAQHAQRPQPDRDHARAAGQARHGPRVLGLPPGDRSHRARVRELRRHRRLPDDGERQGDRCIR